MKPKIEDWLPAIVLLLGLGYAALPASNPAGPAPEPSEAELARIQSEANSVQLPGRAVVGEAALPLLATGEPRGWTPAVPGYAPQQSNLPMVPGRLRDLPPGFVQPDHGLSSSHERPRSPLGIDTVPLRRLPAMGAAAMPDIEPDRPGTIIPPTGHYLAPAGAGGYVNPVNGTYYAPSGPSGVVDTRTGAYVPIVP